MKRICALVFCFVLASASAVYADEPKPAAPQLEVAKTESPKPNPTGATVSPAPTSPPQDSIATMKLTIKLLKQNAKIQKKISKAQLNLQIANTQQQIFQRKVNAQIEASRALAKQ